MTSQVGFTSENTPSVTGREALERVFGEGGGGIPEVECNTAVEPLLQALRKSPASDGESASSPDATTSPTLAHVAEEAGG